MMPRQDPRLTAGDIVIIVILLFGAALVGRGWGMITL